MMMTTTDSLSARSALVTGSTSGIGLGIAKALAAAGANVALNGFGDVDAAVAEVSAVARGGRVVYVGADLRKPSEIEAMMSRVRDQIGEIDVLVNNAGIQHVAPLDEFPVEKWDDVVAINLTSAFHTTRLALPGMRAKNWGRIVNVASVHGLVASANKSAYVAAKHGLVGLTKVTALETAKSRVTCNAICPGWVLTPLVEAQVEARAQHEGTDRESAKESLVAEKQPSGEFVTPDQLARLVLFLCSDAGDQVRGVAWNLDGGWLAQ